MTFKTVWKQLLKEIKLCQRFKCLMTDEELNVHVSVETVKTWEILNKITVEEISEIQ